jgi:hypothetical protein
MSDRTPSRALPGCPRPSHAVGDSLARVGGRRDDRLGQGSPFGGSETRGTDCRVELTSFYERTIARTT